MRKSPGDEFIQRCLEQVVGTSRLDHLHHHHHHHHLLHPQHLHFSPSTACALEDLNVGVGSSNSPRSLHSLFSSSSSPSSSPHSTSPLPTLDAALCCHSTDFPQLRGVLQPEPSSGGSSPPSRSQTDSENLTTQPSKAAWLKSHQLPEVMAAWTEEHFQKVVSLLRRDTRDFSEFLRRFLAILLVHQQLMKSGFFYTFRGGRDQAELKSLTERLGPGSFLLRTSSDPSCLFTMSFKSLSGVVKSTRIIYDAGEYFFDCSAESARRTRRFPTPLHLVQHFCHRNLSTTPPASEHPLQRDHHHQQQQNHKGVADSTLSDHGKQNKKRTSFISVTGSFHSYEETVVILKRPLKTRPDSLMHLTRLTVNRRLQGRPIDALPLAQSLKDYLLQYTFTF